MSPRPHPRTPPTRPAAAAALAFAAACAILATVLYLLAAHTARGQGWDDRLRGGLTGDPGRAGAAGGELLDTISVGSLALVGGALMLAALLRGRPRLALGAGGAVLGANLTTQWLKAHLERPDLRAGWWDLPGSYPSGHATVAMSLALAAVLVAPTAARVSVAVLGGAYAVGVGIAVVGLDWHRPSDALGGYLVAAAWSGLVIAALALWPDRASIRARVSRRARLWGGLGAAAVVLALVALAARSGGSADLPRLWEDRTGLVAVGALCALAGTALVATVGALSEGASSGRPKGARRRG